MTRKTAALISMIVMLALAIQLIPVFPIGGPPPGCGKANFYGWPFLSLTTVANADRSGNIERDYVLETFHPPTLGPSF